MCEPSRLQRPLALILDLAADGSAQPCETVLWDERRRSFSFHWPQLLKHEEANAAFERLRTAAPWENLMGKRGETRRATCWYARGGCSCDYTYSTNRVQPADEIANDLGEIMEDLTAAVFSKLCPRLPRKHWPNSANLNLYEDGSQGCGWHADDESLFGGKDHDCPIVSLSLGGTREFWVARKKNLQLAEPAKESIVELDLGAGDVMSMEGLFQKHCVHFVPLEPKRAAKKTLPRVNVTWRWIVNHRRSCALRSSGEGQPATWLTQYAKPADIGKPLEVRPWWPGCYFQPLQWRRCAECNHDGWCRGRACWQGWCRRCWLRRRGAQPLADVRNPALASGWWKGDATALETTLSLIVHDVNCEGSRSKSKSSSSDVSSNDVTGDDFIGNDVSSSIYGGSGSGGAEVSNSNWWEDPAIASKIKVEEPWEEYYAPDTGARWLCNVSTNEWFFVESCAEFGWTCFREPAWGDDGRWWWHSSGRCFVDPSTMESSDRQV